MGNSSNIGQTIHNESIASTIFDDIPKGDVSNSTLSVGTDF